MKTGKHIIVSLKLVIAGIIIFALVYTLFLTGVGQLLWPGKIRGSIVKYDGEKVGSEIIGQNFAGSKYFHGRPSSINYNALKSAGANLAPNNPKLKVRVQNDLKKIGATNINTQKVPAVLVTESGSSLDPHLTPEAAYFQVPRISDETGLKSEQLNAIIKKYTQSRLLGLFGNERVNVLKLNLEIANILKNEK
ncbi:MAG: potassium-transporting ATPase subunit KdpC [Elusimicrobiota bacterium]